MDLERAAPRRPFREAAEACVSALTVALLLKVFLVEAYRIPSGSMQPTLLGHEFADGSSVKDTVLVDRLAYLAGDPQRFDVAVFRFPLDRSRAFVKRVWGLPGDTLRIAHGDVQRLEPGGAWRALQRTDRVMREMWLPLEPHGGWELDGAQSDASGGDVGVARIEFGASGGALVYPRGAASSDDAARIVDLYRDGYPATLREHLAESGGENAVGDLRLSFQLELPDTSAAARTVVIELGERDAAGWRTYRLTSSRADQAVELEVTGGANTQPIRSRTLEIAPFARGSRQRVALQNLDDVLRLEVDGQLARAEITPCEVVGSRVRITLDGAAEITDLALARDVHYVLGRAASDTWTVPEGAYFVLGDNTQRSVDSREWRLVQYRFEEGERAGEVVRGQAVPGENPEPAVTELPEPVWYFRDEWGERERLPVSEVSMPPPLEAPFVPRDHFVGRAFLVVWPPLPGAWLRAPRPVR